MPNVNLPADLMRPCEKLPELQGKTGREILLWSADIVTQYGDCAARHNAVVQILK